MASQPPIDQVRWYHTIQLPDGLTTPGVFDTPRAARHVPLPTSLAGTRCLDVGTMNGFWAFEMERRGASEVVAIDLLSKTRVDWPESVRPDLANMDGSSQPGPRPFEIASRALGSNVVFREMSAYDLSPESIGEFDFVFLGSLLLHLRDPVRALTAVRTVLRGELLLNETISLPLTLLRPVWPAARLVAEINSTWWIPNTAALRRMVEASGYQVLEMGRPYILRWGRGASGRHRISPPGTRVRVNPRRLARHALGIPHTWVRATPSAKTDKLY